MIMNRVKPRGAANIQEVMSVNVSGRRQRQGWLDFGRVPGQEVTAIPKSGADPSPVLPRRRPRNLAQARPSPVLQRRRPRLTAPTSPSRRSALHLHLHLHCDHRPSTKRRPKIFLPTLLTNSIDDKERKSTGSGLSDRSPIASRLSQSNIAPPGAVITGP